MFVYYKKYNKNGHFSFFRASKSNVINRITVQNDNLTWLGNEWSKEKTKTLIFMEY